MSQAIRVIKYILLSAAALVLMFFIGYFGYMFMFDRQSAATPPQEQPAGSVDYSVEAEEHLIGPQTEISLERVYTECGHTETEQIDNTSYIGKNVDAITEYFPESVMENGDESSIQLKVTHHSKCNNHYIAKEYQGRLAVFRQNDENFLVEDTGVDVLSLPAADINQIMAGIPIESDEDLMMFLEDYTS